MIKRFFMHHPMMKLFSLLLACALWVVIRGEKLVEMSVNIPVKFENLPAGTIMTGDLPDMIRLKLRGTKLRMEKMDDDFFTPYVINLEGARMGNNTYWIYAEDFKIPFGVNINRIQPQIIHVALAKTVTKPVNIEPKISGSPMPGYEVKSMQINPTQAQIRGDQGQLDLIQVLTTEEINLDGRSVSFEGDFAVDLRGYRVSLLTPTAHVTVEIEEKTGSESILNIPIRWTEENAVAMRKANAHIETETASIKVTGPLTKVFEFIKTPPSPMLNQKQLLSALRNRRETMINLDMPAIEGMQFEVEPKAVKLVYDAAGTQP
jgi:YbbR domain-containing protein